MDSRKMKYELALSCKGNLKKYFNKVEILNRKIERENNSANVEGFIHKIINK